MSYDFYAEFQKNLSIELLKEWINESWNNVKGNSWIRWDKKPQELRKILENDKIKFHKIVTKFLQGNEKLSLTQYAKLQKIIQNFVEENEGELKNYTHSLLREDIKNYNPSKSPINQLDLSENPKQAYVSFIHPSENVWFETHKDIKNQIKGLGLNMDMNEQEIEQFIKIYPRNSTLLKITFKLKKPYISQDDEEFYIIDNPICKDKVFKVPIVRPSSWKGALRWVACEQFVDKLEAGEINSKNWKEERSKLVRLFGDEKDNVDSWLNQVIADKLKKKEEEIEKRFGEYLRDREYVRESGNRRGRLFFYPTFFDRIGLDVIAPHDRKTKTPARGPIYFETVPEKTGNENTKGDFYLLYYPFDLLGKEVKKEIEQDLEILKDAIPAMLTKYGFGAKTTAGYGVVEDKVEFQIFPFMENKTKDEHFGKEESVFAIKMDDVIKNYDERYEQRKN